MKEQKPKLKTITMYKRWTAGKYALYAGTFACPIVPAVIVTAVNWEEWFGESSYSLPFGFACLLVTVVFSMLGILNSGTIFKKKTVALFVLAVLFLCIGFTCIFLANLITQLGYMWIYVACGLVGSGTCAVVETKVVEPNIASYKKLISENCLDQKSKKAKLREEQAKRDAELDAQHQAVD